MFSLRGKVAIVTGAARGLGFEIAKGLAGAGAKVVVNGRDEGALRSAVERIAEAGGDADYARFDIALPDDVQREVDGLADRFGGIDILVNNVGHRDRRPLFEFSLADVRRLLEVDVVAAFHVSRVTARHMIDRGRGRIINVTSIAGPLARAEDTPYTIAKGALAAMTRALAAELGNHDITVNGIAPGFFATAANSALAADNRIDRWLGQRTSLGRWGHPREIAGAAIFLASDAASYVTGQILAVDGGYTTHF